MSSRAQMAALRRQRLIAECTAQREDLAMQMRPLVQTLEAAGTGMRILSRLRSHPAWIAAGAATLLLATPRRISAWLRSGILGLRTWRTLAPSMRMLLSRED